MKNITGFASNMKEIQKPNAFICMKNGCVQAFLGKCNKCSIFELVLKPLDEIIIVVYFRSFQYYQKHSKTSDNIKTVENAFEATSKLYSLSKQEA